MNSQNLRVEFGNAGDIDTQGTGWFVGFSEWSKSDVTSLRHMPAEASASGLCVKWFSHGKGHPNGEFKPISEGRTMSMLVGPASSFKLEFSASAEFGRADTTTHILRKSGDFAIWGPGIFHRAYGLEQATILTLRWIPLE